MRRRPHDSGAILILTLVAMPVLLVLAVLVIDVGRMFAMRQDVQNAADAAAKAASYQLAQGNTDLNATATAVLSDYGLAAAHLDLRWPPTTGNYVGQGDYVEVVVNADFAGIFASIVSSSQITGRAVAGHESFAAKHLVSLLDTDDDFFAGAFLQGGATTLQVEGSVVVNSSAGGVDEYGNPVAGNASYPAVRGTGSVHAYSVEVNGGVQNPGAFWYYGASAPNPLDAGMGVVFPDPYLHVPTPTMANGVVNVFRGAPRANGSMIVLNNPLDYTSKPNYVTLDNSGEPLLVLRPGIYDGIYLLSGANVRFEPGIYVLRYVRPPNLPRVLRIHGNARVHARGVMFYATGADYEAQLGLPDSNDVLVTSQHDPNDYGLVEIRVGPNVELSPIDTSTFSYSAPVSSDFDGMLLYKRRANNHYTRIVLQGRELDGTIYMQGSRLILQGHGALHSSLAVRTLHMTSGANGTNVTVLQSATPSANTKQIVLVE